MTLAVSRRALGVDSLVVGCAFLSSEEDAVAIVKEALAAGVVEFDVAPLYGKGVMEKRLGKAIGALPESEAARVRVATKAGRLLREQVHNDFSGAGAEDSLRESLDRLGVGRVHCLRIHDPNDSPERPAGVDEVGVAFGAGGMVERLVSMRANGAIARASLGMNTNVESGMSNLHVPSDALPPSLVHGAPSEVLRVLGAAAPGTFDEALLAGGWTLLSQTGLAAMAECQRLGVEVAVAGVFATGLLVGQQQCEGAHCALLRRSAKSPLARPGRGALMWSSQPQNRPLVRYAYQRAPAEKVALAERWAELAAEHGTTLSAVAVAFAWLPDCVSKVVLGVSDARQLEANLEAVRRSAEVPLALFHEARTRGLLGAEVPLPALSAG